MDRAWQLYQETLEKGIPLDTETYNSLIRVASFMREGSDLRWKLVKVKLNFYVYFLHIFTYIFLSLNPFIDFALYFVEEKKRDN